MRTLLFVNHPCKNCGVYQFGRRTATALQASSSFETHYVECGGVADVVEATDRIRPDIVYYNYHPSATPWMNTRINGTTWNSFAAVAPVHDDICGEFDAYIFYGPWNGAAHAKLHECGRCCPEVQIDLPPSAIPRIATFGFACSTKRFGQLAEQVARGFARAAFSIHLPPNLFVDPSGEGGRREAREMQDIVYRLNPQITVDCTFQFLSEGDLLSFLGRHDLLVFDYNSPNRGISSVIDYALMVRRPLAVNRSSMFRHVLSLTPSVCYEDRSLGEILHSGIAPLRPLYEDYAPRQFIRRHETIFNSILS